MTRRHVDGTFVATPVVPRVAESHHVMNMMELVDRTERVRRRCAHCGAPRCRRVSCEVSLAFVGTSCRMGNTAEAILSEQEPDGRWFAWSVMVRCIYARHLSRELAETRCSAMLAYWLERAEKIVEDRCNGVERPRPALILLRRNLALAQAKKAAIAALDVTPNAAIVSPNALPFRRA